MPPYDEWANCYDMSEGDRAQHIRFYGGLITAETRSLLELGCGTGVITTALAQGMARHQSGWSGIRVTGLDESAEMLRIARARENRIEWVLGNFCSPPVVGPYDLVICCFYALQNLLSEGELAATFYSMRRLLTDHGIVAFDLYQPNLSALARPQVDRLIRTITNDRGEVLEVREDRSFDPGSRVLTADRRLVQVGSLDDAPLGHLRIHLRQYFPREINRLLKGSGLSVKQRFGDFDRSEFTIESKNQILICTPD
jgi:SAM-dependent methyltransferase